MKRAIKGIFTLIAKASIVLLFGIIFFMSYVGFVYIFLGGNIPKMTSLWSSISLLIGMFVGGRLVEF